MQNFLAVSPTPLSLSFQFSSSLFLSLLRSHKYLRRKPNIRHDARGARLVGEVLGLREPRAGVLETGEGDLAEAVRVGGRVRQGVADDHAEARAEGRHLGGLLVVGQAVLHVVDGHAALGALEADVGHDGHPLVRPVARAEEEHRRPVVRRVLEELARRAVRFARHVLGRVHRYVEGVLWRERRVGSQSVAYFFLREEEKG